MMTQKKKDLKGQYQVADLKEYDVMCTRTTAYPMRRAVMGEQWSEKLGSKQMSKSTPPSPVEKVSTLEIVDTEEVVQFKRPIKRTLKEKLQAKDDSRRYSTSDIQLLRCLLDVPDVVLIQYQEGDKPDAGARNVTLQVSLPVYQNITDETVIKEQSLGSKKSSKEQGTQEQIPERSYVGYYEGTIGLFEKPVTVGSSKTESVEGLEVPSTWPPSLVYGITPSASSDDDKRQHLELESQPKSEDKGVDISLAEFTETILNDSIVQVTPIVRSDATKGRVQTPLEKGGFTIPTAESICEGELRLTPSYERRKDQETNQYQVSKEILSETIDEEAQMISLEVQKAMEGKYKAEQEAIQLKLQQEKLQREQEELARKQAEELSVKEQQQQMELEKEKALSEEQQRKTQELKDRLTPENIESREKTCKRQGLEKRMFNRNSVRGWQVLSPFKYWRVQQES